MILTGAVAVLYAALFFNPALIPASLRPPSPTASATALPLATATETIASLAADAASEHTATATPLRATPTPTATVKRASATPRPTTTITSTPSETPTATLTPTTTQSRYPYTVQPGYPRYSAYPGGCNWLGFSGEVFDLEGKPVLDLVVHIGGVDHLVLSGASQEFGIKGWVDKVAERPAGTRGFYTVQLQDTVGNPLSDVIGLDTFNDCTRNLVTLNFVQNH